MDLSFCYICLLMNEAKINDLERQPLYHSVFTTTTTTISTTTTREMTTELCAVFIKQTMGSYVIFRSF